MYLQSEGYDSAEGGHAATGRGRGRGGGGGGGGGGAAAAPGAGGGAGGGGGEKEEVSLAALRIAIGSRMQYQYQGSLPKEFLMGLARERNRIGLGVGRGSVVNGAGAADGSAGQVIGGVRLPPEKYCLTGVGWGLKEEWDSEGEDEQELPSMPQGNGIGGHEGADDGGMGMGDEDEEATMEDIFGDDDGGGGGGAGLGGGEDEDMADD